MKVSLDFLDSFFFLLEIPSRHPSSTPRKFKFQIFKHDKYFLNMNSNALSIYSRGRESMVREPDVALWL